MTLRIAFRMVLTAILVIFTLLVRNISAITMRIFHDGSQLTGKYIDFIAASCSSSDLADQCNYPSFGRIDLKSLVFFGHTNTGTTLNTVRVVNAAGQRGIHVWYKPKSCSRRDDKSNCPLQFGHLVDARRGLIQDADSGKYIFVQKTQIEYVEDIRNRLDEDSSVLIGNPSRHLNLHVSFITPLIKWRVKHFVYLTDSIWLRWHTILNVHMGSHGLCLDKLESVRFLDDVARKTAQANDPDTEGTEKQFKASIFLESTFFPDIRESAMTSFLIEENRLRYVKSYSLRLIIHPGAFHGHMFPFLNIDIPPSTMMDGQVTIKTDNDVIKKMFIRKQTNQVFEAQLSCESTVFYNVTITVNEYGTHTMNVRLTNSANSPVRVIASFVFSNPNGSSIATILRSGSGFNASYWGFSFFADLDSSKTEEQKIIFYQNN